MHLMVGVGYGLLYSAVVAPVRRWPAVMKGLVFGLSITAIALAAMPIMAAVMSRGGTSNPCNPCAGKSSNQASQKSKPANPCNPCAAKNPCNPCAAKNANSGSSAPNACNPCGTKKAPSSGNPCGVAAAGNPCNPCGGGGGSPYSGLISLINHVIFGLALAFAYGRGGT